MQDKRINAFRSRLIRDGYEDISIFFDGVSRVTVCASYKGKHYNQRFNVADLCSYPIIHRVYFDEE